MEKAVKKSKYNFMSIVPILRYLGLTILFYIMCRAKISFGNITPFCFGLYYALIFLKDDNIYTTLCFVVAYMLSSLSLIGVYEVLNLTIVALFFKWFHKKIHKKFYKWLVCLYALLGNIVFIIFNVGSKVDIISTIISLFLGLLFLYCCQHIIGVSNRNINIKLSTDEVMCLGLIIIVVGMGLSNINLYGFEFVKCVGAYMVLLLSFMSGASQNLVVSSLYGLGASIYYNNITYLACFVLFSLCAIGFKSNYKIFSCIAIILVELIIGFYFSTYVDFGILSVVSVVVGEILFLCTPLKLLNNITTRFTGISDNVTIRTIIDKSRDTLTKRMLEVSNVFADMDMVYKKMVKGNLSDQDAKAMLKNELFDKCCKTCAYQNKCMRENFKVSTQVFDEMVDAGYEKGKLTLLDVPQYLTSNCSKVNVVLNTFNALLLSYKRYANMVTNMDYSKILIADQLKGLSLLLRQLCEELQLNIVYDVARENRIKEELNYKNICCLDVIVYEQCSSIKYVTLMLNAESVDKAKLEKIISKIVGSPMYINSTRNCEIKDTIEVVLKTKPNYDIVFGSSACTKSGQMLSGDTHSLIKIDDGKYMIALCDGMGSGEQAHKLSDQTITLIENFYKAGFDNDIILSSVNKLLSLNNDESFSALDICVLDLRKNIMDFIKLGSPYTFIKHKLETEVVAGSGLPIGVLDEMRPHITKKVFTDFDIIVFVSDGVMDAIGSEELTTFINNSTTINPQTLADDILDKAIDSVGGKCEDDYTVVAVRIYKVA